MASFDWRALGQTVTRNVTHNWLLKLGAIAFAIGLWGFVNLGAREADRSILVRLEFLNLPPKLMITSPIPESVDVRLRGPRTILGTIDERRQRIAINLGNVRTGLTSFKIDADMLNLPRGVTVTRLTPVQVTLDVERIVERMLPVVTNLSAAVPAGYRLVESEVRPAVVSVTGPAPQVEALRNIPVGPLHLPPTSGNFDETVVLERPADLVRLSPDRVIVRGVLEELVTTQDFRNVEIGARNPPPEYHMRPRKVDVTIRGPQRLLRELRLSSHNFYVDLAGIAAGYHAKPIEATVPQGLDVLEIRPPETTVEVAGTPAAGKRRSTQKARPR
ncbi:MAG TPA: CdaR family protein [Candidatus Binatia bacterium]|nr:CdaR family protein [Candidatus Binatia bacterium]